MKRNNEEEREQIAFIHWCTFHPILKEIILAIPNGGFRRITEAVRLKKMGVRKGVSDIFIPYPTDYYHGLWIEFKPKRKGNRKPFISAEQRTWILTMRSFNYAAVVAEGCDKAIQIWKRYIDGYIFDRWEIID